MCIESDTNRFKVGDGVHTYDELPYCYGIDYDERTIIQNSEGILLVPIDDETITVGDDGLLHAAKQVFADHITIQEDSEHTFFLDIDDKSLKVNADGKLEAITLVKADGTTIIDSEGILSVPFDLDTIYIDTDGKVKAKGDVVPGKALD